MKNSSQNKKRQRQAYHGIGAVLSAAALSAAMQVQAAEDAPAVVAAANSVDNATGADSRGEGIASVTVTATRRNASLQSVPLAVSVIDGEELARTNRNSIDSIVSELPSVSFRQQGGNKDTTIFVRGIGTISTSPGVEPTVSTVVDGVVYARPGQATIDLLDIDRLEVLRGPQGTLFGKNASSGVINIVSRKPGEQTAGFVDASVYEGGERRAQAGISGTVAPGLATASLTLLSASYDGNVSNLAGGDKVNGYDRRGARARVDLTPTPDLDVSLIADILRSGGSPTMTAYKATTSAFAQAVLPVVAAQDNRSVYADVPSDIYDLNKGLSAQLDWRKGGYTFTSITAVRDWDNEQHTTTSVIGNSADASRITSAYPATRDIGTVNFEQVSQELRVASPKDRFAEYVAGAFYLHGKDRETYQRIVGTTAANGSTAVNSGLANYGVVNESSSLFGEATLHFTPVFRGIVGARWTRDELEYDHARTSTSATAFSGVQPAYASSGDTSANGKSGRLGAQYDFGPDVTGYATYSRGYKGPAYNVFFNMLARDTIALQPETSNSFELGLKSSVFQHRLTANLAVFKTDYDNYQANFYDTVAGAVVTRLINAGKVSTRGVELDVNARPVASLTLAASLAYTDARIDQFNCPAAAAASCSLNGKTLPFSPSWKSFVRANYTLGLDNGLKLDFGSDYSWQSKTQFDLFQSADTIQGAYGIVNASIALSSPVNGWRVALVGKNLGNKSYATNLVTGTGYVTRNVPRDDERYFGINVRKDF
jgi:iron complex outermembrane receptor protein